MLLSTTDEVATTGTYGQGIRAINDSTFLDSEFRYVLFPVVYGVIFILGLFANIYVLFVLRSLREAKAMSEIRIYMTNLTIADLLFVCALPFWIGYYSRHGNWVYKDFMCRLTGSFFFINTYCSILFLAAISVNRYWAVTRPMDVASSDHRRRGIIVCVVIWLLTVLMSIPHLAFPGINEEDNKVTRCFEGYQNRTESKKKLVAITHLTIIGLYFVVFVLVLVCNFLIARALLISTSENSIMSASPKNSRRLKRKALHMLWAVVGVFVICFLPHHVIQGPWSLAVLQIEQGWGHKEWDQETRQALNDAHQITLMLMGLNCILDPVVYCFATRKFRKIIMAHIRKIRKAERCPQTVSSHLSMDSKNLTQRLNDHQQVQNA